MTIVTAEGLEKKPSSGAAGNLQPPSFVGEPQQCVTAQEGTDITITAELAPSGGAPTAISWRRGDQELVGDRFQVSENNNTVHLNLHHVTRDDVGHYTLTAKNAAGETRRAIEIRVEDPGSDVPVFLRRLSDLAVKVGTRTRFLVEIRSSSDIKVSWHRNDQQLEEGERFHFVHEGNFFCVDVAPVMVEDGGRWTCMAEGAGGRTSCSSHLNVLVPKAYKAPEFLAELQAILTEQGTVSLECKVVGVPTPVLRWYKDGKEIKAGDIFALTANADDPTSLGTYTCEAVNCMGKTYSSSKVHVVGKGSREGSLKPADSMKPVGPPPVFKEELRNEKIKIGDAITLACQVAVPPWPQSITWYNKEGRVEESEKYHVMADGLGGYMIEINQAEAMDEGEWKCVATSNEGAKGISQCRVSMTYPKNYRKPRFLESLKAILTDEGLVSFECKVVGFPTPQLRWFKDGQELKPGDVYQLTGTNSLGSYSCIAKNCMGEATSSAELTVEDIQNQLNEEERLQLFSYNQPPKFIQGLKSCEAKIAEEFRFTIQVSISPEPSISWYRDDEQVEDSNRYLLSKETLGICHLDVHSLEIVDQAEWKCVATNDFGHSVTSCFLKLIIPRHFKKPRFLECLRAILSEEGAVNLECKVIGVPQPVLKWYKDGEELKPGDIHRIISGQDGTCCLGTYTCEAHNCMGTVASSASLLGFEERLMKGGPQKLDQGAGHVIARNPSLSTIHEERTSQMYDTPATERSVTVDERAEVSFSFDGKEVSVSLYETPDLTEEEALQVVEMYADQLSEHVSEHNVVELPPLRFVKETSNTGKLLMEAVVIDVTHDVFGSAAEDDLRTDADLEELSITDDNGQQAPPLPRDTEEDEGAHLDKINTGFLERALAPTVPYTPEEEPPPVPKRPPRKKSESKQDTDTFQSLSPAKGQTKESDTFYSISPSKRDRSIKEEEEKSKSEHFTDAAAHTSELDSKIESASFASARGSSGDARAFQIAAIEEQRGVEPHSTKSSPPELIRNIEVDTKKKKDVEVEKAEIQEVEAEPKEISSRPGSLKKKMRSVESGLGRSFEESEREEKIPGELPGPKPERPARRGSRSKKERSIESGQGGSFEESGDERTSSEASSSAPKLERRHSQKKKISSEVGMIEAHMKKIQEQQKLAKDEAFSDEGDGLKTAKPGEIKRSSTKERRISTEVQTEGSITRKRSKPLRSQSVEAKESEFQDKGEELKKHRILSASSVDLPTLQAAAAERSLSEKGEGSLIESLTRSLQDIQKGLASVEEQVKLQSGSEPGSAKSSLSVLEALSQPIEDSLALVERQVSSERSPKEQSPSKILETISQPIQEFQKGLALVEQQIEVEMGEESLLEKTSVSILENVAQPVQELQRDIALIQLQQQFAESKYENIPKIKEESLLVEEFQPAIQTITQSIHELQRGIAVLQQHTVYEEAGETSSRIDSVDILETLSHPLHELRRGLAQVEEQAVLETSEKSIGHSILEAVAQPLQELQKGLELVEQQTLIETEPLKLSELSSNKALQTLSQPIEGLQKGLAQIGQVYLIETEPTRPLPGSLPVIKGLQTSLQELHQGVESICKLNVLQGTARKIGVHDATKLPSVMSLDQPLINLQKCLINLEISEFKSSKEHLTTSEVVVPSLKSLKEPLSSLQKQLTQIEKEISSSSEKITSESSYILTVQSMLQPLKNLQRSIATLIDVSSSDSGAKDISALNTLACPLKDFTQALVQIEQQAVLETVPKLTKDTKSLSTAKVLTQSIQELQKTIVTIDKQNTSEEQEDPGVKIVSKLVDLAQPLSQLKQGLIEAVENIAMEESKGISTGKVSSVAIEKIVQPLDVLEKELVKAEQQLVLTKKKADAKTGESIDQLLQPIQNLKLEIESIRQQAIENVSEKSPLTLLESLVQPLQSLQMGVTVVAPKESSIMVLENVSQTVEALQRGVSTIEKKVLAEAKHDSTRATVMKLGALTVPLKELQKELNLVEQKIQFEPEEELLSEVSSINTLRFLVQPLQELQKGLIQVEKFSMESDVKPLAEKAAEVLIEPILELQREIQGIQQQVIMEADESNKKGFTILENLAQPLRELQRGLSVVEEQNVMILEEAPIFEKAASLSALEKVTLSIQELHRSIATIEHKSAVEQVFPVSEKAEISALAAIAKPLMELHKGLIQVEDQIFETGEKPLPDRASILALETMAKPLQELTKGLAQVEEILLMEPSLELPSEKLGVSALETLAKPLRALQKGIAVVQYQTALEADSAISEQGTIFQTLAQPLQDLQHGIAVIEEHAIIEPALQSITEKIHIPAYQNLVQSIEGIHKGIALSEKQAILEGDGEPLSEVAAISLLKTMAKPLKELQKNLVQVEEQIVLEAVPESQSELSKLGTLATPVRELQRGIALIEQHAILEPGAEPLTELSAVAVVQAIAKPIQEIRKGLVQIHEQVILEAREEPLSEKTDISILKTLANPIQQLQKSLAVIEQQALLEPSEEPLSKQLNISALETLAQPLKELHKNLIQVEQQVALEAGDRSMSGTTGVSILETIAHPVHELQRGIALIQQQAALEAGEFEMSDKSTVSMLKTLARPLHELQRGLAQVEEQVVMEAPEEPLSEKTEISVLKTLAQPLREIQKSIALIEKQAVYEPIAEPLSDVTSVSLLKTLAIPLHELQQNLVQIQQQVALEAHEQPIPEKSLSVLKTLAQPVQELQRNIALIEQQALLEAGDEEMTDKTTMSMLQTLAQPMQELHNCIAHVQQQIALEAREEEISEKQNISLLLALAKPMQEVNHSIALIQEQAALEPSAEPLSERTSMSALETLAEPVQELLRGIAIIQEQARLEHGEELSEKESVSLLKRLAEPIQELQRNIVLIQEQAVLEAGNEEMSDRTTMSMLQTLAEPVEEIQRGIAQVQQQIALEAREEEMSDKTSISILQVLAKPIQEFQHSIALIQEQRVYEPAAEPISDKTSMSTLETLAEPVQELLRGIALVQEQAYFEHGEELSEKENISVLKTLAQPIAELHEGLTRIEQVVLEGRVENIPTEKYSILETLAQPIQELQRGIAMIEKQSVLETVQGEMSEKAQFSLLKQLAKPLQELQKGILMIEQQEVLEAIAEPLSDDTTNISELPTLASTTDVSQDLAIVHVEEQRALEGDVETLSDKTDPRDLESTATARQEMRREIAIIQQQTALEEEKTFELVQEEGDVHQKANVTQELEKLQAVVKKPEILEAKESETDKGGEGQILHEDQKDKEIESKEKEDKEFKVSQSEETENKQKELEENRDQEAMKKKQELHDVDSKKKDKEEVNLKNIKEKEELTKKEEKQEVKMIKAEEEINKSEDDRAKRKEQVEIESKNRETEDTESKIQTQEDKKIREEEERIRKGEADMRKRKDEEERLRKETEETEISKRKKDESESRKKKEEEDKKKENEEAERKKKEKEEAELKSRKEEENKTKKEKEEEERKKKEIESKTGKQIEEEETDLRKKEKEEIMEHRKKETEAEIELKKKKEEDEAESKKTEEGKIELKKKEEEIEIGKIKDEEESERKIEEKELELKKKIEKEEAESKMKKDEEIELKNMKDKEAEIKIKEEEIEIKKKQIKEESKLEVKEEEKAEQKRKEEDMELKKKEDVEQKKTGKVKVKIEKEEVEHKVQEGELKTKKDEEENKKKEQDEADLKKNKEQDIELKTKKDEEDKNKKEQEEDEIKKKEEDSELKRKEAEEEKIKKEHEVAGLEKKKEEETKFNKKKEEEKKKEKEESELKEPERKEAEQEEKSKKEKKEAELRKTKDKEEEKVMKERAELKENKDEEERKKKEQEEAELKKRKEEKEKKEKEEDELKKRKEEDGKKKKEQEKVEMKKKKEEKEKEEEEARLKKKKEEEENKKKEQEEAEKKTKEEKEKKEKEEAELKKKKEDEEKKKKEQKEAELKKKKEEKEKKEKEEAELKKKKEEEEKKKKEQEEAELMKKNKEKERKEKEEAELKKKEEDEEKKKKEQKEAELNKKKEEKEKKEKEEAELKKKKEEEEKKKKEQEEAELKKKNKKKERKEKEEAELKEKKKEEERKIKEQEEAELKKKKEEKEKKEKEEAGLKKKEEEEEKKKKGQEEAELKKKKEEKEKKEKEEAELKKKKEEEEKKKKEQFEAELMKKNKEKERKEKEEAELKKKKDEEENKKKEQEEAELKKKKEEKEMKKKEEAELKKKKDEEEKKKKEQEEAELKKKKEEKEKKEKEEAELKNKKEEKEKKEKEEAELKKKKEEEEQKKKEQEEVEIKKKKEEKENKEKEEAELKKKKEEKEKKKKEEAELKKKKEEEEQKKKEQEEVEIKKKKEEKEKKEKGEAELKKKKEEEEQKKKEQEEVEIKKKKEEKEKKEKGEAELKKKKEEKEKEKEEAELKKKKEEEEQKKKEQEEVEVKKKKEEKEKKEKEEAELKNKKEEKEKKEKEEAELKKKKEEEEQEKKEQEEVEIKKKKEEKENKEKEEAELKKKKEEKEKKKKEEAELKKKKEEEEQKKKEQEEVEIKKKKEEKEKKEKEEAELKEKKEEKEKKEKEEAELKKKKEDEEKKKKEQEEAELKKKNEEKEKKEKEEAELKKKKEEEEKKKREQEEAELKKKNEEKEKKEKEEAELKKKKEEEEKKKKEQEEAELEKKKEENEKKEKEEAELKKRKEEEEKKKKEQEEADLKKKKEEKENKKKEESKLKKKKEEEEQKKKEQEEFEIKKKKEEKEKKEKDEVELKKKKEEEKKIKEQEEAELKKKKEEKEKKEKEEAELKKKKDEEEKKKKEQEEAELKKKKEEKERKEKEEAELKKKKEEEMKKKEQEEAELKKNKEEKEKKKKKKEKEEAELKKKKKEEEKKKKEQEEAELKKKKEEKERIEKEEAELKKKKDEEEKKEKEEAELKKKKEEEELKKKEQELAVLNKEKKEEVRKKKQQEEAGLKNKEEEKEMKKMVREAEEMKERKIEDEKKEKESDSKRKDKDVKKKDDHKKMEEDMPEEKTETLVKFRRSKTDVDENKSEVRRARKSSKFDVKADSAMDALVSSGEDKKDVQWVADGTAQRTRSFDQPPWGEDDFSKRQVQYDDSLESTETITFSSSSSTLTPTSSTKPRSRGEAAVEETRRITVREKVESGPRDARKKPTFATRLTDRTAAQGSRIKLMCSVVGTPDPSVEWLKDGLPLVKEQRYKTRLEDGLACLEVLNASPGDSAEYTCVARNLHGEATTSATLKVFAGFEPAPSPPTFTRSIKDSYRFSDDELILECRVRSHPPPKITWLKDGMKIEGSRRHQQSELSDGICRLVISSPDPSLDNGQYICQAENNVWTDQISTVIQFEGRESQAASRRSRALNRVSRDGRRPHLSNVLTDYDVPAGGLIALQIEAKGAPKLDVTWMRGSETLKISAPKYRAFEESGVYTLLVADASEKEAGRYTCRVANIYGHVDTSAAIGVVPHGSIRGGKPAMFINRPELDMFVAVGEDISVSFRVSGDPKPKVTWMKGIKDITHSQRSLKETMDDYVRLTLKRALVSDAGTYWILAKNVYGCDRAYFTVSIRQRARSMTPSLEWNAQTTSNILRDIKDGMEISRMKDVPGPVAGEPVVIDSGRNWLTLSWPKTENRGGAPVLAYRVEAWPLGGDGGARWVEMGVSPINTFDAFNLKSGMEYKFRVTPRNRYGWGESVTTSSPISVGRKVELPEFIRILPGQLKALQGTSISLECQVKGDPIPQVRWCKDGMELNDPRFITSVEASKCCQLKIQELREEDSGRYMCEATNNVGRVSTFARLFVVNDPKILEADNKLKRGIQDDQDLISDYPPQFTMRLRDRRVQMTYPVRLTCQVAGRPTPDLVWSKDGEELKQDDRHIFWNEDHFHTLEINRTTLEDSGCYSATARNANGAVSCRCNLVVDKGIRAYVAPEFLHELELEYTVREGGELRLSAQVEAYPTVGVMWHRDGVRLRPSRRIVMTLDHDGTVELALAGVTARDAGVYSCTATNEVGRAETSVRVNVQVAETTPTTKPPQVIGPEIPYSKEPLFITKPRSTEAVEGDMVIILCEVVGDPKPEVVWLRDWLKPDYYRDAPHFRRVGDGPQYRLEIPRAKLDFTGAYSVIARNCNGEAKAVISLQIYAKGQGKEDGMEHGSVKHGKVQTLPVIRRELKDLRCCDGDAVTLECSVQATPEPDIRWEKGGRLLPLGGDFNAEFDGETARLHIHQVYPEDEGEYTCVAYNELGRALTSACLVVDVPEEKETLLSRQLSRPPGLLSAGSTPRSTPRTTPSRSKSPSVPRHREGTPSRYIFEDSKPRRLKVSAPKFYAVPHNRVAEEGETVRFQCAIAGHPTPWVTWDKDGILVTPSSRLTLSERDDLRILEITEVTVEDAGFYRITLENEVGRIEASARLEVINRYGGRSRGVRAWSASPRTSPTFGRRLIGSAARVGNRLTLACDVRGSPTPGTAWYRNGELVVRSSRITPSWDGRTARLEIEAVELEDAGMYTCVAENDMGKTRCSARLLVLDKDDPCDEDRQPPVFLQGLPPETVTTDGEGLELQVRLQGTPPLDVVWVKDSVEIPDCEDFRYVDHGDGRFALRLADVFPQDSGEYRCEAYNEHGDAFTSGSLIVKEGSTGVQFSKRPTPVLAAPGGTATFCARLHNCSTRPSVSWTVAGRPAVSPRYKVESEGDVHILHINPVELCDSGQVTCVARSGMSSDDECVATTELTVREGDLWCDDAAPWALAAANGSDEEEGTPALLLRGPLDTTALRGDRVVLKATYIGSPLPLVRWLKAGHELTTGGRVTITNEHGVACLVIENITADDSGKYVVSVENNLGADCHFASVAVEGPADPPAGRPSVFGDGTSVNVAWSSSPYDGGCMVTGYCVEMRKLSDTEWQLVTNRCYSLSYMVAGLTPGEQYVFRVRAENAHGLSEASSETEPFLVVPDEEAFLPAFEPRIVSINPSEDFKSNFEVLEELGKGRYGVVHKVKERSTGEKFAAKFIRCIKAKDREKVQEEIDIMNILRHPKLLQLAAAFESPREIVMVMEYISGGELFERVVADDFTLTERDCILFMRQICEGVDYMHQNLVVHLDLKPENIMCHTRTSHQIKLIDFGLAQKINPDSPIRVLFGTPEFIPPEIINYEPIGVESDMWSVGVICYVLLSGLSPFMGDNDAETFANITRADYDFDDEAFDAISQDAKDFISALLVKRKEKRLTAKECLQHTWLAQHAENMSCVRLCTDKLKKFIIRRKWQKTGNAIRALGRMATLSAASRRNSNASSTSGSPRPSLSGCVSRMSSLNEEDLETNASSDTNNSVINGFSESLSKTGRMRVFSERSDSGISDCSSITAPTSAKPLLDKKCSITEEVESCSDKLIHNLNKSSEAPSGHEISSVKSRIRQLAIGFDEGNSNTSSAISNISACSSSSSAKINVEKTDRLKQQSSVDSGVHVDISTPASPEIISGKVSAKKKELAQLQKQQQKPKEASDKNLPKVSGIVEARSKVLTRAAKAEETKPKSMTRSKSPLHHRPPISTSHEHSTNYQKAMAFWKR